MSLVVAHVPNPMHSARVRACTPICYNPRMIWKIFKRYSRSGDVVAEKPTEQKVKAGIDFTIKTYGETLRDLARYDRGEQLSS
jgi:hypothetical protein